MAGKRSPARIEALIVLGVLALVVGVGVGGWAFGHYVGGSETAVGETVTTLPPGHTGEALPPEVFGDPARGAQLWEEKSCSDCHSYNGQGGTDAPPLDYMKQHLSAREIASMSGNIWNHLPQMLPHFEEEGIPFPTFEGDEMADLIAFLHSGGEGASAAPEATTEAAAPETGMAMAEGDPAAGKEVFEQQGCASCHTFAAAGSAGTVGPDLDESLHGKDAAYVEQAIVDPDAVVAEGFEPGSMPPAGEALTDEQLADLVAFLTPQP